MIKENAQTLRMRQARTMVTRLSPFYASLMLGLEFIPDKRIKTMMTDGVRLWYNPDFVDSIPFEQICGVVAHEAHHCGANHPVRIGDRDLDLYQRAADYATNPEIRAAGFILPPGHLYRDDLVGLSVERIYNILDREREQGKSQDDDHQKNDPVAGGAGQNVAPGVSGEPQQGEPQQGEPQQGEPFPGSDFDVGGCGGIMAPMDPTTGQELPEADQVRIRDHWHQAMRHAAMVAKKIGNAPGAAEELVKEVEAPRADWKEELRKFMQAANEAEYSWMRPDRRFIHSGLYIPSLYTEQMPGMAVAIDTSASLTTRMLEVITSEFNAVLDDTKPEYLDLLFCDTQIRKTERYEADQYPVSLSHPGRGGTRVAPVFDAIEEFDSPPTCLVYFTDLEVGDIPEQEPAYPVLWAVTSSNLAPVHMISYPREHQMGIKDGVVVVFQDGVWQNKVPWGDVVLLGDI